MTHSNIVFTENTNSKRKPHNIIKNRDEDPNHEKININVVEVHYNCEKNSEIGHRNVICNLHSEECVTLSVLLNLQYNVCHTI